MSLNSELAAFLEMVEANTLSGKKSMMHELTPEKARLEYDVSTQALDCPGPSVESITTISIPCRDGQSINARLYKPIELKEESEPLPVLLYFHGGGYCVGSLDSHDSLCRTLAAWTPCCVLNVAYRLAPEYRFPTAVHDAQDAYQWVLSSGSEYGLDVTRIAVGGDSAGGTLATGLTIAARDNKWPQPVFQVLLYPCASAWQNTESHGRLAKGYLLEAPTLQWMFSHYLRDETDRMDVRFAPLEASDLSALAPALLVLAEYDPLIDEGVSYGDKLKSAGVSTLIKIYSGVTHDFARLGNIITETSQVRKDIAQVLANALRIRREDELTLKEKVN